MPTCAIGIVVDGATGRLGTTQHLRALLAIAGEGGLPLANGDRLMPQPLLLGRDPERLAALAGRSGGLRWSTDRDACLADPAIEIYFDASATGGRPERGRAAFAVGKHVYLEKPIAGNLEDALSLVRAAEEAGRKGGVVQDKLFLPGLKKLRRLYDAQFFGRVLSVRLEFGWWVFDGEFTPAQRPSWNYQLEGGALAQIGASWANRVKRDDLLQIQVDGTLGSAVAGLHRCFIQPSVATPRPFFSPEQPQQMVFGEQWQELPELEPFENGYRAGWELFLRHVAEDAPFPAPLIEGAKSVQLAEACYQSHRERRWVEMPALKL